MSASRLCQQQRAYRAPQHASDPRMQGMRGPLVSAHREMYWRVIRVQGKLSCVGLPVLIPRISHTMIYLAIFRRISGCTNVPNNSHLVISLLCSHVPDNAHK